jgi:CubicO group peptidase (beta-lactamase class C family)
MAERGYPGLAVSVRIGDSTGWSATLGFADVESASPIATDSRFAIGSISKSVSAAAVMRLADRAAVDIDQDVRRLVPRAATLQHPVTLRQLMSHQGGVRHYRVRPWYPGFSEFYWNMQVVSSDAALALFLDDGLRFEPDRDFLYSTFGYTLAASAVEAITGQTFADIVAQEVARPLGLNTLAVDAEGLALPGRTRDYRRLLGGGLATARPTNNSMRIAGAGFVASVDDLARFGIGLLDSGFISHDTRELMLTPRRLRSGEENPQRYALGWRVGQLLHPTDSTRSVRIVHHGGSAPGAESVLLVLPEQGISVAMAGNARTGGSGALLQAAADIARLFAFAP